MELIAYFIAMLIVSIGSVWVAGFLYGLFHRPAIYFPFSLAFKMAACVVFGSLLLMMVGGPVLSTLVFNAEMKKRSDYSLWPCIVSGALISTLSAVVIYYSAFVLAWEIIG